MRKLQAQQGEQGGNKPLSLETSEAFDNLAGGSGKSTPAAVSDNNDPGEAMEEVSSPVSLAQVKNGLHVIDARAAAWTQVLQGADAVNILAAVGSSVKVAEMDELVQSLLLAADGAAGQVGSKLSVDLINWAVSQEVEQQKDLTTLFRVNSFASKLLKQYTSNTCGPFIAQAMRGGVLRVLSMDTALEIDNSKVAPDLADRNVTKLTEVCEGFINDIVGALSVAPRSMRQICNHISVCVGSKFGREDRVKALGIGAYVFLRMLCPVFIAPDKSGFPAKAPEPHHSRTFILVSKVIQNLANQVLFGKKEPFMVPLNSVVKSQQERVNTFLLELAQIPAESGSSAAASTNKVTAQPETFTVLHTSAVAAQGSLQEMPSFSRQVTIPLPVQQLFLATSSLQGLNPPQGNALYSEGEAVTKTLLDAICAWNHILGVSALLLAQPSTRLRAASSLCDMYGCRKQTQLFARHLIQQEIVYRATINTGAWEDVSASALYMGRLALMWARDFLKHSIGNCVQQLVQGNLRYEVDLGSVRGGENVDENADSLVTLAKTVVEGILGALVTLPAPLWDLISLVVTTHAPAGSNPKSLGDLASPSAFLMESLLVPALLNPVDYWLSSRSVRPESERSLQLLVSILRMLSGSPVVVGTAPINHPLIVRFIEQNRQGVQRFIEDWASLMPSELPSKWAKPSPKRWPEAASFYQIHEILFANRSNIRSILQKNTISYPITMSLQDVLTL